MAAKSLLRQIRDKESDLDRELDRAVAESRSIVEDAQRAAEAILREAELAGSAAAEEYLRSAREQTDREIAALREDGRARRDAVRARAEARLSRAAEHIVKAVSLR